MYPTHDADALLMLAATLATKRRLGERAIRDGVSVAVRRRLAELEDTLQVELFNRSNRGTEPTPAAFALLNLARGVLNDLDGIATQMRAWRNDPASAEPVRTLARLLHTLKGSARMAGAMRLGEITHAIETRVDEASRSGAVTLETIDEIHASLDAVQQIIERLQGVQGVYRVELPQPAFRELTEHQWGDCEGVQVVIVGAANG